MPRKRVDVRPDGTSGEPTDAELVALELQEPVHRAELALVDAELAALDTPGCRNAVRRVEHARVAVLASQVAVIAALVASLVGAPLDYGKGR